MFQAVPLSIIRISLTVHLALVYVIRFEDSFRAGPAGPARKLSSNCSKLLETCRSSFFSQNKFGKLVHLLVLL